MLLRRLAPGAPVLALVLFHCSSDPPTTTPQADAGSDGTTTPQPDAGPEPLDAQVDAAPDAETLVPTNTESGGTRFEARYNELELEDGTLTRTFEGFYDRTLGTMCHVGSAGVDKFYCLPDALLGSGSAFLDASCTQAATVQPATTLYTVADDASTTCDHDYRKLGPATTARVAYHKDGAGACVASNLATYQALYPLTPIAIGSLGEFTKATETFPFPEERGGSRLVLRGDRFTHPDGSFVSRAPAIFDSQLASTGEEALAVDGMRRFIPARRAASAGSSFFGEDTCAAGGNLLALTISPSPDSCSSTPERRAGWYQTVRAASGCSRREYHPRPTTTPLTSWWYHPGDGTCAAATPERLAKIEVYPAGSSTDEAPPTTLVALTHRWASRPFAAISGTQVVAKSDVTESADGLSLRTRGAQLFLKVNDTPCRPGFGAPGDARCRPDPDVTSTFTELYSDAGCTLKTIGRLSDVSCDRASWPKKYIHNQESSYPMYRYPTGLGTRAAVWEKRGVTCVAVPPTAAPDYFDLSTLTVVPETEFPKVVRGKFEP